MKAHIGVDAESGLVHTVISTAANVNDVTQAGALLHGQNSSAFGDAGYRGADKRPEAQGPTWFIAMQPGKRRALAQTKKWARLLEQAEQLKASVRAKVERIEQADRPGKGHRIASSASGRPQFHLAKARAGHPPSAGRSTWSLISASLTSYWPCRVRFENKA